MNMQINKLIFGKEDALSFFHLIHTIVIDKEFEGGKYWRGIELYTTPTSKDISIVMNITGLRIDFMFEVN